MPQPLAHDVPSPCISVCRMDAPSGLCMGCWRTLNEIASWATMGADDKRAVWQLIEQRQLDMPAFADDVAADSRLQPPAP